jgi:hypothetical protein
MDMEARYVRVGRVGWGALHPDERSAWLGYWLAERERKRGHDG